MITTSLPQLAHEHCQATKPALSFKGFIRDGYGVGHRFFARVAAGKKKPSQKLLRGLAQAHLRLFPTEPVLLQIPNHPPVLLGDASQLN